MRARIGVKAANIVEFVSAVGFGAELLEMFLWRHGVAVIFRPVGINAHRSTDQLRGNLDREQHVEIDKAVKSTGPFVDVAHEETEPSAQAAAFASMVVVGVVVQRAPGHVLLIFLIGAKAVQGDVILPHSSGVVSCLNLSRAMEMGLASCGAPTIRLRIAFARSTGLSNVMEAK